MVTGLPSAKCLFNVSLEVESHSKTKNKKPSIWLQKHYNYTTPTTEINIPKHHNIYVLVQLLSRVMTIQHYNYRNRSTLRARCTNVVQLWTQVKSEFEPSSAVNCVAPKWFKHWSPFNSELPSDHRSNFDLGSTRSYACALGTKYFPWYYCCKKLSNSNLILSKKLPRIEL